MIDACIVWDHETAYFFRGDQFYRWEIGLDAMPSGYPRPIAADWPGWPEHWVDVESAVCWPNGRVYFFREGEYLAFDLEADSVLEGYPQYIHGNWSGFPAHWTGVDAAVVWPNGRAYFFRGGEYLAFDVEQDEVMPGYPQPIHGNWRGFPAHWPGVDSAVVFPNGRAYFFRNNEVLAFDIEADCVVAGYPQPISTGWKGLPQH